MRKIFFVSLAIFLFLLEVSYAQEESGFERFSESALQRLEREGSAFVNSFETAGGTVPGFFTNALSAFDPGYCGPEFVFDPVIIIETWFAPAIIVTIIILFSLAVLYMGGQFFQSPNLIALAKDELYQTIITVLRVMFIIGTITAGNLFYSISAAGTSDPIYLSNHYMIDAAMAFSRTMVAEMINNYSILVIYNMVIHTIYSSTMWVGVSWRAMYNFNLGPVLKPLMDIIGMATQYLSLAISEWMVHIIVLCFIKRWMWGVFIPLGMVLRAVPYTRNAGEALLMLTFALGTIYPFMFIFDYEAHKLMKLTLIDGESALQSFIARSGIFSVSGALVVLALLMGGVIFPFFVGSAVSVAFELIRSSVYYIVIMSMLLPFLNIFITLTLAREWARVFNVNINFLGFLRIL